MSIPTDYPTQFDPDKYNLNDNDDDDEYDDETDDRVQNIMDKIDNADDDDRINQLLDKINNPNNNNNDVDDDYGTTKKELDDDDDDDDNVADKDDDEPNDYYYESKDDDLGFTDDDIDTIIPPTVSPTFEPTPTSFVRPIPVPTIEENENEQQPYTGSPTDFEDEENDGGGGKAPGVHDDNVWFGDDDYTSINQEPNSSNNNDNDADAVVTTKSSSQITLSDEIKYGAIGGGISFLFLSVIMTCVYWKYCRIRKGKSVPRNFTAEERYSLNLRGDRDDSFYDEPPIINDHDTGSFSSAATPSSWASATVDNGGLGSPNGVVIPKGVII